jgi:hypothetical protein
MATNNVKCSEKYYIMLSNSLTKHSSLLTSLRYFSLLAALLEIFSDVISVQA